MRQHRCFCTIVITTANGDRAFVTMTFWDGAARDLGSWKRVRIEMATFLCEHAGDEHWRQCFVSCGEYDPEAVPAALARGHHKKVEAVPAALAGKVVVERLPP